MKDKLELSVLGHVWILDLDGTVVKHNGYLTDGEDTLLEGAREFLRRIPEGDMVVILTSRRECWRKMTDDFLKKEGIRYDHIIFEAPYGERIIINDAKPGGMKTTAEILLQRDVGNFPDIVWNDKL